MRMVQSVTFHPDGSVMIEYVEDMDLRVAGRRQHAVAIAPQEGVIDVIEELEIAAERTLKAVLEHFEQMPLHEEAEDKPGYDNPEDLRRWDDAES